MKVIKACFLTVIALVISLAVILFYRIDIVNNVAPYVLESYGIHVNNLIINDLTSRSLDIAKLDLEYDTDSGGISIDVDQISVDFDIDSLLDGEIYGVTIGKAAINHKLLKKSDSENDKKTPMDVVQSLLKVSAALPIKSAIIDHLTIETPLIPEHLNENISIKLVRDENHSRIDCNHAAYSFNLNHAHAEKTIQGGYRLDFSQLRFNGISGMLHGRLAFDTDKPSVYAEGDLRQFHYDGLSAKSTSYQLMFEPDQWLDTISISEGSNITIDKMQSDDLIITGLILPTDGLIRLGDQGIDYQSSAGQTISIEKLQKSDVTMQNVSIDPRFSFNRTADAIKFIFDEDVSLELSKISIGDMHATHISMNALQDNHLVVDRDDGYRIEGGRWQIETSNIIGNTLHLKHSPYILKVNRIDKDIIDININAGSSEFMIADFLLELDSASLRVKGDHTDYKITGMFTPVLLNAPQHLSADYSAKSVTFRWRTQAEDLIMVEQPHNLDVLFKSLDLPLVLEQASIGIGFSGKTDASNSTVSTSIRLQKAVGKIHAIAFDDLSMDAELQLLPKLYSKRSVDINVTRLNFGLVASNLVASMNLEKINGGSLPAVYIESAQVALFDGLISSEKQRFDPNIAENHIDLTITGVDLEKVVESEQFGDLDVEGRISGDLRVEFTKNGIKVHDGRLSNDGDGTISYHPEDTGDPQDKGKLSALTDVVYRALEDFRYHTLEAKVDYQPRGDLIIDLHLEGKSPRLDTNKSVHLNVSSQQNILSLLESLQYSQGLNQAIDGKIRNKLESTDIINNEY